MGYLKNIIVITIFIAVSFIFKLQAGENQCDCDHSFTDVSATQMINYFGTNYISNQKICIYGFMVVDTDISFDKCQISMGKDAEITHAKGKKFSILNKSIVKGCNYLWRRIIVERGSHLIVNNSTIQDAKWAVFANGHHGSVTLEILNKSAFKNNYISVYSEIFKSVSEQVGIHVLEGEISNSDFIGGPLLEAFQGRTTSLTGIELLQMDNFNLGNKNSFSKLENGILARKIGQLDVVKTTKFNLVDNCIKAENTLEEGYPESKLNVRNIDVSNALYGVESVNIRNVEINSGNKFNFVRKEAIRVYESTYADLSNNSMKKVVLGIRLDNIVYTTGNFNIKNNDISNCSRGIYVYNSEQVKCWDNKINIGLTSQPQNMRYSGIAFVKSDYSDLRNNTVKGNSVGHHWVNGIEIGFSDFNYLKCNKVENLTFGMWFDANTVKTTIVGNEMLDCGIGIEFNNNSGFGSQGSQTIPSDNKWKYSPNTPVPTIGRYHTRATYTDAGNYLFYVRSSPSFYEPTLNHFNNGIQIPSPIIINNYNQTDICNLNTPYENYRTYTFEQTIANNTDNYKAFKKTMKLESRKYLYKQLKKDNELLNSDQIFELKLDSLQASFTGQLYEIIEEKNNTELNNTTLETFITGNNSLIAMNQQEEYIRTINNYYALILKNSVDSLDSTSIDLIKNIALLCPYDAGVAVFSARTIMSLIDTLDYSGVCIIETDTTPKNKSITKLNKNIKAGENIVPNPSFEEMYECPPSSAGGNYVNNVKNWWVAYASPDYNNVCNNKVPNTAYYGYQYPRTGDAMIQLVVYGSSTIEYIQTILEKELEANKQYKVQFYANVHNYAIFQNSSLYYTNRIEAYFSTDSFTISSYSNLNYLDYEPQIKNPHTNFITDTLGWILVEGIFTAQGGEKAMTIGRFGAFDTLVDLIKTENPITHGIYLHIDDVSVTEYDSTVYANELIANKKIEFNLYPNPSNGNIIIESTSEEDFSIAIFNSYGQKVYYNILKPKKINNLKLDLSNGVYYCKLLSKSGTEDIQKLIIKKD